MEDKSMIYNAKLPGGFGIGSIQLGETDAIRTKNTEEIERIKKEAMKESGILYRFVYEPIENDVDIYQVIRVNRITCTVRYCPIDGKQDMVESWGAETCVGTNYIRRRLKAWSMTLGYDTNAVEMDELPNPESEVAYQLGNWYLYIQTCCDGYDYSFYNETFQLINWGFYNIGQSDIFEAAKALMKESNHLSGAELVQIDQRILAEAAGSVNAAWENGMDPAVLERLIIGNAGDMVQHQFTGV